LVEVDAGHISVLDPFLFIYPADWISCTAPGGYVELGEFDGRLYSDSAKLPDDHAFKYYLALLDKALQCTGRKLATGRILEKRLRDAGFIDIKVTKLKLLYSNKEARLSTCMGIEAYGLALFTRVLKMDVKEAKVHFTNAKKALMSDSDKCYSYL
jgi:hypothetical protein